MPTSSPPSESSSDSKGDPWQPFGSRAGSPERLEFRGGGQDGFPEWERRVVDIDWDYYSAVVELGYDLTTGTFKGRRVG